MATITDIADAVKDELNGQVFAQPFTAERAYLPVYELAEMDTLRVTVVPKAVEMRAAGRGAMQRDYRIDVGVQKRLSGTEASGEIDALMDLVEAIAAHFRRRRLAGPGAVWIGTENSPAYAVEHLDRLRQFTSVVTLTFRVME